VDLSGRYVFNSMFILSAGVSNLTNTSYSTRRASAYPGPGKIPSDGRRVQVGLGFTY
jgi:Fe(3+) dicitrate transport protein